MYLTLAQLRPLLIASGANVLLTEQGDVKLCDFGVAGTIETKLDKRSTFIGTIHWMAPELFNTDLSYGKEVDIWAFGSMVYEIATGLPPNVDNGVTYDLLGSHLKTHAPRLQGDDFSDELQSLVAYCLQLLPSSRPTIEQVQKHAYIYDTNAAYPTSTLADLVLTFKEWEYRSGGRESLVVSDTATSPSKYVVSDEWNFDTTAVLDKTITRNVAVQDVQLGFGTRLPTVSSRQDQLPGPSRRRPPPAALAPLRAPLEKVFDPNTTSNYGDNSQKDYGHFIQQPISDLPLRDDRSETSIRDTLIDIGEFDSAHLSSFPNLDVDDIQAPAPAWSNEVDSYASVAASFSRSAPSISDTSTKRRTQD